MTTMFSRTIVEGCGALLLVPTAGKIGSAQAHSTVHSVTLNQNPETSGPRGQCVFRKPPTTRTLLGVGMGS
jgi:hypothetical protein